MPEPAAGSPVRSVRHRLLAIALLPMLVILPLLLGVTMLRWTAKFDDLLNTKVNSDLTVARQYLARILETTGERVEALGQSTALAELAELPDRLPALLEESRAEMGLDFLYLATPDQLLATSPPGARPPAAGHVLDAAWQGHSTTGIDIVSAADLAAILPDLAAQARVPLVPTPNAVPTARAEEDRGMIVHTASPVVLPDGSRAILAGGLLLNRNLDFIDRINDLVYREGSLPDGSQGTATLFLDDVRISTNVRLFEGSRALGTRVSAEVREAVLGQGRTWLDSAFVVNDWYISAYEPITDSSGARVGMLYVGFLEAPFAEARRSTLWLVVLGFLAVTAISVPIFLRWARGVFRPVERMTATIAAVEGGDLDARTGLDCRGDELSRVAHHFDQLLDRLQERERELRDWNDELNARVEETTRRLILSEKLATIGEITASVAHEINNPVAVIQGNLDLLREMLGEDARKAETEFRLLDEQVHRIGQIVGRLLQFARPEEYAGWAERSDPRGVIADCLPLVRHLLGRGGVSLRQDTRSGRMVLMNRTELQQVLINLIVNAINAMPEGGEIVISTEDAEQGGVPGVRLRVTDTGMGMQDAVLARIFEPFFTTRAAGDGTGLGLSICRTLIERSGGAISAESRPGQGTTFTLWLPEAV
ncbi:sensor histidine kinase [Paracoccus siganidrum]|uniref:histidine kinase n=1 Tax=Paracoccus siganidrum TaxID=1276757 RepID=A0A419A5A5_9RHOB|nr:cache domain-containing protein [Paracoccus siganidrum]RJL11089.1 HAMP domain-containing protein [Paracoccus siganidrum]RMC29900.1 two-component sensor histidine kinase [Paracoccus siganidrum]